jgi:hypothetical protein
LPSHLGFTGKLQLCYNIIRDGYRKKLPDLGKEQIVHLEITDEAGTVKRFPLDGSLADGSDKMYTVAQVAADKGWTPTVMNYLRITLCCQPVNGRYTKRLDLRVVR